MHYARVPQESLRGFGGGGRVACGVNQRAGGVVGCCATSRQRSVQQQFAGVHVHVHAPARKVLAVYVRVLKNLLSGFCSGVCAPWISRLGEGNALEAKRSVRETCHSSL